LPLLICAVVVSTTCRYGRAVDVEGPETKDDAVTVIESVTLT
jgi:hypothetical protein